MIPLLEVTASNKRIAASLPSGLIAVFVGGTSGIGEYTFLKLATYAVKPRAYIVGRSREDADRIIGECRQMNSGGRFEFIQADVSVLKNVDDVCRVLKEKEEAINILFMSTGTMAFKKKTADGLNLPFCLYQHSRTRFVLGLLPLLQRATSLRRVVSIGAATLEGAIDLANIIGEGFPLRQRRDQGAAIHTLLLEHVARQAPDVSFVHDVPGVVKSKITRDAEGFGMRLLIAVTDVLGPLIRTPVEEAGERHLFLATSALFPPAKDAAHAGLSFDGRPEAARGTDGKLGSGVYSVDNKGESASPRVEEILVTHRKDGTADKVWEIVSGDFTKILGSV